MSRPIAWYVAGLFLRLCAAVFAVVVTVYLVADFGDRVGAMGRAGVLDVLELYWNKALVAAQQLGPAAVLLSAAATVSTIRKRGELTALMALAFTPAALYVPILLSGLLLSSVMVVFDELVVTRAVAQVDEIAASRFDLWTSDWSLYHSRAQWLRSGDALLQVRGGDLDSGLENVTILRLKPDFTLAQRVEAARMVALGDGRFRLEGVRTRSFLGPDRSTLVEEATAMLPFTLPLEAFRVRLGRPESMRLPTLAEQITARAEAGLSTALHRLAVHQRFSYPLTGVAAALVAVGLSLRPSRKGHLTVAILESFAVAAALWGMMVVARALVLAERLPPVVAAWTPTCVLLVIAGGIFSRALGFPSRLREDPPGR